MHIVNSVSHRDGEPTFAAANTADVSVALWLAEAEISKWNLWH